jgi:hypothetical protein
MTQTPNPTTVAKKRYLIEFGVIMAVYVVVLLVTRTFWGNVTGPMQYVLSLAPLIPVAFAFAAIVRYISHTDELQRRIIVESLALAGGATAMIAVTYGFLEGYPLPRPSAWATYTVFMIAWGVSTLILKRRYQ